MAGNNTVSSTLPSREYSCKICDLSLDSKDSLDVHLQYHKENLYMKWGTSSSHNEQENEPARVKNEPPVSAPADSSDNMITKPSPEFQQRSTPETTSQFPHPATPQSYHSAPSPYQNPDQTNFSPNSTFPTPAYPQSTFPQNNHGDLQWEQQHQFPSEYHKPGRYHPYSMQDRVSQVSSSSPLFSQPLNQPTPSPSPNQCDKCGFVCESAVQLTEHCNSAHSTNGQTPYHQLATPYNTKQYLSFNNKIKEEQEDSPDILDLDSHKVVYQGNEGDPPFERNIKREVTNRIPQWGEHKIYASPNTINVDGNSFKEDKVFSDQKPYTNDQKFYQTDKSYSFQSHDVNSQKPFLHHEAKIYPGVQIPLSDPYANTVVSSNPDSMKPPYRPFDSPTTPQISSTQQTNPTSSALPPIGGKGANWKSNEARRPKTYNCTACNKWFTSSGHLKRHYNTTLHKNAVRSSGQPDPAGMPISAHHHPTREQIHSRAAHQQAAADSNTQSPMTSDEVREDTSQNSYAPQGYDRSRVSSINSKSPYSHLQQGSIDNSFISNSVSNHTLPHQVAHSGSQPPDIHSQINKTNSPTSIPPNGEAGPSATNHHLRGLLSVSTNNISAPILTTTTAQITPHTLPPFSHLAANPYSPRPTDPLVITGQEPAPTHLYLGQNFQETIAANYPNGMAPHVMDLATNNLHIANPAIIGEFELPEAGTMEIDTSVNSANGRLPSFAHIQCQIGVIFPSYIKTHNVGGVSPGNRDIAAETFLYEENSANTVSNYASEASYAEQQTDFSNPIFIKTEPKNDVDEIVIKIEDILDYANKENYERESKSPSSPESAKLEYDSNGSPSVSSTVVGPPLTEINQPASVPCAIIHKCYQCDKVFNRACYLTQHNKTFHSGEKPFKCDRCGKRFPDGVTYEEHISKHAGIKPFKCQQCPKSFNHKTDLRRHMCLHSGTKPYACSTCGKGFIRNDHMVKHCETHLRKPNKHSSNA